MDDCDGDDDFSQDCVDEPDDDLDDATNEAHVGEPNLGDKDEEFTYGRPGQRNKAQHHALAARMREAKMRKQRDVAINDQIAKISAYVEALNRSGGNRAGVELRVEREPVGGRRRRTTCKSSGVTLVERRVGGAHSRLFTWSSMLDIAFDRTRVLSVLARFYECSERTIRRVQCGVAHAYLCTQVVIYGCILAEFSQRTSTFAVSSLMWDETGEKLQIGGLKPEVSGGQRSSTWQIMVTRMSFCWGWDAAPGQRCRVMSYDVVAPPTLVLTPAAHNLWHAFTQNKCLAPLVNFRKRLLEIAAVSLEFKECDGASGNDKLIAHWTAEEPTYTSQTVLCRNHRNHLGVVHVVTIISLFLGNSLKMLADFYAACLFLKMGGHFMRLLTSCRQLVQSKFEVKHGMPPASVSVFNAELIDYLVCVQPFGRGMGRSRHAQTKDKNLANYRSNLETYFAVCNGRAFGEHYDKHDAVDVVKVKQAMVQGVVHTVLRSQPSPPNEGKWTKLGPCLDFFCWATLAIVCLVCAHMATMLARLRRTWRQLQPLRPRAMLRSWSRATTQTPAADTCEPRKQ